MVTAPRLVDPDGLLAGPAHGLGVVMRAGLVEPADPQRRARRRAELSGLREGQGELLARGVVRYTSVMTRVYSARVRGGVVVPDGVTLPDGASVTIAVNDEREAEVELSPAELAELDDAIAEAECSESVSSAVVLAELDHIARNAKRK